MPWACRAVHSGTGLDLAHSLAPSLQLVLGSCWPFGSWTVGVVPGRLPCSLTLRVNSKMLLLGRQHWPVWFSSAHKSKSLSSVYLAFLVCEVAAVPVCQLYLCPRGLTSSRHLAPGYRRAVLGGWTWCVWTQIPPVSLLCCRLFESEGKSCSLHPWVLSR